MDATYSKEIRPILDCFDKIKENLLNSNEKDIQIPEIVVVGIQSSGKSSVLESISNIQLPRGENTVTKCPIELQLRNSNNEEYAMIRLEGETEKEAKKIQLCEIASSIEEYQAKVLALCSSPISTKSIYIQIHRKDSPDLTLKDLPGLYYKSSEVEDLLKAMYIEYTKSPQAIILLVLPATSDLSTSPAIAIIRSHPDYQTRTIPVVTKIDLKKNEPKFFESLIKNELNLTHLPIVVRNRTQSEIDTNESIETIRKREQDLIQSIPELAGLPPSSKGINELINLLLQIQKANLLNTKMTIKETVTTKLEELKAQLRKMPKKIESQQDKNDAYLELCELFYDKYKTHIGGYFTKKCIEIEMKEKMKTFCKTMEKSLESFCTEEKYTLVNLKIQN